MCGGRQADRKRVRRIIPMPTAVLMPPTSTAVNESGRLPDISSHKTNSIENTRLTIHRRTASHHGSTLRTLGHAAEYLAASRAACIEVVDAAAEREAIHILMRLSRQV